MWSSERIAKVQLETKRVGLTEAEKEAMAQEVEKLVSRSPGLRADMNEFRIGKETSYAKPELEMGGGEYVQTGIGSLGIPIVQMAPKVKAPRGRGRKIKLSKHAGGHSPKKERNR